MCIRDGLLVRSLRSKPPDTMGQMVEVVNTWRLLARYRSLCR